MIQPVREDNLEYHVGQIRWMGYPLAFLLVMNLTCVVFAVVGPGPAASDPNARSAAVEVANTEPVAVATSPEPVPQLEIISPEKSRELVESVESTTEVSTEASQSMPDWALAAQGKVGSVVREFGPSPSVSVAPVLNLVERLKEWNAKASVESAAETAAETATTEEAQPNESLVIYSPLRNPVGIQFVIGTEKITLHPGDRREFPAHGEHLVQFHRGGKFGYESQTLQRGVYRFEISKSGWSLVTESAP